MKKISRSLLAAALMMALPVGGALACTVGNWNGTNTATDAESGGPADGVARYQGLCALSVGSGDYVVDNSPSADGTYRARFYVLTRATSGAATVFKATTANDGGGTAVIEVTYDGNAFAFSQNGTGVGSVNAAQGKWYSVEMSYEAGTGFDAWVWGAGSDTQTGTVSGSAGAGTINSAVLGISNGTVSSNFNFDSFVSTRGEDRIPRLCKGDTNGDSKRNILDVSSVLAEMRGDLIINGQPDANEDGTISILDVSTILGWMRNSQSDCS